MSHPHPHPHSSTPGTLRRASWGEHGDDEDEDDSGDYEDSAYGGGDNRSQPGGMYAGVYGDEAEPDGGMDINEDARPPQQVPTTLTTVSNMVSAQSAAPLPQEQIAPNTPMTARPPPHIDFVAAIRDRLHSLPSSGSAARQGHAPVPSTHSKPPALTSADDELEEGEMRENSEGAGLSTYDDAPRSVSFGGEGRKNEKGEDNGKGKKREREKGGGERMRDNNDVEEQKRWKESEEPERGRRRDVSRDQMALDSTSGPGPRKERDHRRRRRRPGKAQRLMSARMTAGPQATRQPSPSGSSSRMRTPSRSASPAHSSVHNLLHSSALSPVPTHRNLANPAPSPYDNASQHNPAPAPPHNNPALALTPGSTSPKTQDIRPSRMVGHTRSLSERSPHTMGAEREEEQEEQEEQEPEGRKEGRDGDVESAEEMAGRRKIQGMARAATMTETAVPGTTKAEVNRRNAQDISLTSTRQMPTTQHEASYSTAMQESSSSQAGSGPAMNKYISSPVLSGISSDGYVTGSAAQGQGQQQQRQGVAPHTLSLEYQRELSIRVREREREKERERHRERERERGMEKDVGAREAGDVRQRTRARDRERAREHEQRFQHEADQTDSPPCRVPSKSPSASCSPRGSYASLGYELQGQGQRRPRQREHHGKQQEEQQHHSEEQYREQHYPQQHSPSPQHQDPLQHPHHPSRSEHSSFSLRREGISHPSSQGSSHSTHTSHPTSSPAPQGSSPTSTSKPAPNPNPGGLFSVLRTVRTNPALPTLAPALPAVAPTSSSASLTLSAALSASLASSSEPRGTAAPHPRAHPTPTSSMSRHAGPGRRSHTHTSHKHSPHAQHTDPPARSPHLQHAHSHVHETATSPSGGPGSSTWSALGSGAIAGSVESGMELPSGSAVVSEVRTSAGGGENGIPVGGGAGEQALPRDWDRYPEGSGRGQQQVHQHQNHQRQQHQQVQQSPQQQSSGYQRPLEQAHGAHHFQAQAQQPLAHTQTHTQSPPQSQTHAQLHPQAQPHPPTQFRTLYTSQTYQYRAAPSSRATSRPAPNTIGGNMGAHNYPRSPWLYAGEEAEYDDEDGEGGLGGDVGADEGAGEEGLEVGEDGERPKKRRRTRVALSCAECKRRKIKCDRAQPCTPCARRGDQSNCKWAVLETKDGTPSRAEFEALQTRLAQVERVLYSIAPSTGMYHIERAPPPSNVSQYPDTHYTYVMRASGSRIEQTIPLPRQPSPGPGPMTAKFRAYPPPRHTPTALDGPGDEAIPDQRQYRIGGGPSGTGSGSASGAPATSGGGLSSSVYANHHASGSGYATNGPVFPPPSPMAPCSPPVVGSGTRSSPIKIEDLDDQEREGECREKEREREEEHSAELTPRASSSTLAPPPNRELSVAASTSAASVSAATSEARPTLRLLPEALRQNTTPGRLSGTTFPLSDADWEQMTSVALTGANKQRPEAGSMHVDVQRELEALVGTLPGKESCDRIWRCYVDRLEWQHCVVHPDSFQQMYDMFWAFKTHAERASFTPIAWLALLLIVMSHGLATMRPTDAKAYGIAEDTPHWRMLCTQLWIASERALALDNFSHAVTLEVVQTLVLLSYRSISLDPKGWFHQAPILAMAIRLAMCIGINNVSGDKAGEVPPPGLCKRELWRRIWFNIVYLDWRFSVPMGETYFINNYHYNSIPPANLDWNDLNDGTVFRPKPRRSFTSSSMFLAKVQNADRVRELCDALNLATRNGHQDVTRLFYDHEVAVNNTITLEPPCLISKDETMENANKRVKWARIGHTLELDYRAIQIHRSFLVADFREARVRGVCIDTAEKMLDCFVEGKHVDAPSAWWWYGYTACVVLMMEQYYSDLQPQTDATLRLNQKLDNVIAYVAMQRNFEEVTVRAWDGILILETLIAELQKRRIAAAAGTASRNAEARHPSLKRTYDQIDSPSQTVTRVSSSSPIHAFRKWILNVMPFLKIPHVPGIPLAHARQRDMDAAFWDAILDIDTELHKSSRKGNFLRP